MATSRPALEHPIVSLFKPVLEKGQKEGIEYLLDHPVLTSPYYSELLKGWAAKLDPGARAQADRAIALASSTFAAMKAGKYKVSPRSPLELALNVAKGNWTLEYAKQIASSPEFFVELMYPIVTGVCETAESVMVQDWRPAVTLMRILFAALDARGKVIPENQLAMELTTVETWLVVACRACGDVPDGRIFRDAVARGDKLVDLETNSDPPAPITQRLGVLHLDTYVAGRSSQNLDIQMEQWRQRLYQEYGSALAGVPKEELELPPATESLQKAVNYFRKAAAKRTGEARGRSLKAMTQAFVWLDFLKTPMNVDECVAAAREALTLLPVDRFPAENAELNRVLERFDKQSGVRNQKETVAAAKKVLQTPLKKWLERTNAVSVIDVFHQNALSVVNADPALAIDLFMAVDPVVQTQTESVRREHDSWLLAYAPRAFAPADAPKANGQPLEPVLQALFEKANKESWAVKKAIYSLIRLAASTTNTDQEGEGLETLQYVDHLAKKAGDDPVLDRILPHLKALLMTGHAVNAFRANQFGEAARRYSRALQLNLNANQPLLALDMTRRLVDLTQPDKPESGEAMEALVVAMAEGSLRMEIEAEEAATTLIQTTCRFAMSTLLATSAKSTLVLFLLDVAKGRRFRSALTGPDAAIAWLESPRATQLLNEIEQLRLSAKEETASASTPLDNSTLLTAYVGASEGVGGGKATEQVRNLQIKFDRALDRMLSGGGESPWFPTIEALQALLDDKVILAIQYLGSTREGVLSLFTMLLTREDSVAAAGVLKDVPSGQVVLKSGEQSVTASMYSLVVSGLRDRVVSPPGPWAVDMQAQQTLNGEYELFFGGPFEQKLKEWRAAGKDHICVYPHGPFHFYPFHLLGPEDAPMAADWCMTYVPHPRLLMRDAAAPKRKVALTSIGINFEEGNSFGLGELTESEDEAKAIADVYKADAKLLNGPGATESAVRKALTESRRVHFSTHGLHNVSAPAFQSIFVHPDANDDGIIHAYELLQLDLKGLDLVTFSACETALGRFDISDNLRGIPAALLIAGVSTIVGTLWNVESETATYFFTRFYSILKEKGSKKSAFYEAQTATRRAFPKYRDWGAFQFIGSW